MSSVLTTYGILTCIPYLSLLLCFFFFNDTAPTEIYTLSLHDALPIYRGDDRLGIGIVLQQGMVDHPGRLGPGRQIARSEEHTSELHSGLNSVGGFLLEKKKKIVKNINTATKLY